MKNLKTLRHTKTNDGFTLIELLVVILIIAILAAVGIVALLSALNSGRKSSATTVLRNGITAMRSWQTSRGQTTYEGASPALLNAAEPDITWLSNNTEATAGENSISMRLVGGSNRIFLATKSEKGVCYYAQLIPNGVQRSTTYASEAGGTCSGEGSLSATYYPTTKEGWNN